MKRTNLFLCLLITLSFGLLGCNQTVDVSDSLDVAAKAYQSGSTIEVTAGQTFALLLDSNVTTGYQWQLAQTPDAKIVTLVGSEYIAPETSIPGRGGQEKWTFRAQASGSATLNFKYVRSWEPNTPAQTTTYTITVH
jgi:inhibitor of cysteine peptidase